MTKQEVHAIFPHSESFTARVVGQRLIVVDISISADLTIDLDIK